MANLERWCGVVVEKKKKEMRWRRKSKMVQAGLERLGLLVENSLD